MTRYLTLVQIGLAKLSEWATERVPRTENLKVDTLAGINATFSVNKAVLLPIYFQATFSISSSLVCSTNETDINQMHKIETYLWTRVLPGKEKQAHKIRVQVVHFTLIGENLYRRYFRESYLKCLSYPKAQYVLVELHESVCGNPGGRTLAHRAHTQGYYWPTMRRDNENCVKMCDRYQRQTPIPHMPSTVLNLIMSPQPFALWGMDIVSPLPVAATQKKLLLIATNYFSKWVESKAYASIKDKDVSKLVWRNIACLYGILQAIMVDNGP